jgi:hypothetical protein
VRDATGRIEPMARRQSHELPGVIFGGIVVLGIVIGIYRGTEDPPGAVPPDAASSTPIPAAQPAPLASPAASAQPVPVVVRDRASIARDFLGQWSGQFGSRNNAFLSIASEADAFTAVLENSDYREQLQGELQGDNTLVLRGVSVTRIDGSDASGYSLDTLSLRMAGESRLVSGDYTDDQRGSGSISMSRTSASPRLEIATYLDSRTAFANVMKVYGYDYRDEEFLRAYLDRFDGRYDDYRRNEFELKRRLEAADDEIAKLIASVKPDAVYKRHLQAHFKDYDFSTGRFAFEPFAEANTLSRHGYPYFQFYNFPDARRPEADTGYADLISVRNHTDFSGLPMDSAAAESLLQRAGSNRRVYVRYYYSILDERLRDNEFGRPRDRGLVTYAHVMEVWTDAEMRNDRIGILRARTEPPPFLLAAKARIEAALKLTD